MSHQCEVTAQFLAKSPLDKGNECEILFRFAERITSREIVPTGRIFPHVLPSHERSSPSSPFAFARISGNEEGQFLVIGRVRFLAKPRCLLPVYLRA
jgi:hypothetical protein